MSTEAHLCFECGAELNGPYCPACNPGESPALRARVEKLEKALREALAEVVDIRRNTIEVKSANFRNMADEKFAATINREIARLDATIWRAKAALQDDK